MKHILNKQVLSDIELSALRGGTSSCYVCQCNGTGTWYGNYSSANQWKAAVKEYYSGGGDCQSSNSTLCPAVSQID